VHSRLLVQTKETSESLGVELSDPFLSALNQTVETVSHKCGPERERPSLWKLVSSLSRELLGRVYAEEIE
jgi:hypothetical protein